MSVLLGYVLLGLSLAAPIGPINAAQLDRGLKGGFLKAWFFGIGANLGDIFYVLLVYFGLVAFIDQPIVRIFLWLFGSFVLIYTGIDGFKASTQWVADGATRSVESNWRSLTSGFLMSVSNPMTILFWVGIYGSVFAEASAQYNTRELILYSGAVLSGLVLWDLLMATLSGGFRVLLQNRILKGISLVSSISLLGFGCYFGYRGLMLIFP